MKSIICLIVLCMVASLDGRYRCDYTHFLEAEGWLKLHSIPANWREARLRCHLEGGVLASPLNSSLKQAMRTLVDQNICPQCQCAVFTGIHSTFSKGDYFSVEGVPLLEIPHTWAPDEPDNFNDSESCLAMLPDGSLADVNCDEPFPYMCYKKLPANVELNNCGTIDPEYKLDERTGSCYKFHKVPRTWSRAFMTCAAEGGHLAIVNSDTEAKVLKKIIDDNPSDELKKIANSIKKTKGDFWMDDAFLGFHDWEEHGEWLTIDGRTLEVAGYSKFSPGEPNNVAPGEFCGAMYRYGMFNDLWCDSKYAFICEKAPDSPRCPN